MKKFLILTMFMCIGAGAWAGHEGHNHGDDAFLSAKTSDVFVLSETQIKNLDLQTTKVQKRIFYETVELPALIKKPSVLDDTVVVQGYLSEQADILKLKKGQEVSLKLDAFPTETFMGEVTRTDTEMNPKTGFFTVMAQVENLSSALVGFKGVLTVRVSEKEEVASVPVSAVQGSFGDYFVFVKDGEHFIKTPVVIGHKSEGWQEVVHGLHMEDTVVTQGSYQLQYVTGLSEEEHIHESGEEHIRKDNNHEDESHEHNHRHASDEQHFEHNHEGH